MSLVRLDIGEMHGLRVATITLNRPERANALVPELVNALNDRLEDAASSAVGALVLTGAGRFFSSGGDVRGFADAAATGDLPAYCEAVVGGLQRAVLALLSFPAPVLAAVRGGVTGGATGLVLAADLVAMEEMAFIQPYYAEVGFAPDGGWTALLPEKIGISQALEMQFLNERVDAAEALLMGLAHSVADASMLDIVIDDWISRLAAKSGATLRATRELIWDEARLERVAARLEAEKQAFLRLVELEDTQARMARFAPA